MGTSLKSPSRGAVAPYGFRLPWLTAVLLGIFISVFLIEQRYGQTVPVRDPDVRTLIALGGLNRHLALSGEWYRLLTAPFLHASLSHLVPNLVAFAMAGYALERLLGTAWMFSIFAAGAGAGSLASLAILPAGMVSVGASGGIMAMLTALFMSSFRLPPGWGRTRIQIASAWVVVPAMIPPAHTAGSLVIDYGAHFGGAVFGAVIGFLLLQTWRSQSALPEFQRLATAFAAMAALSIAICGHAVAQRAPSYPRYPVTPASQNAGSPPPGRPIVLQRSATAIVPSCSYPRTETWSCIAGSTRCPPSHLPSSR